jgi:chemotaxis protein CheD
VTSLRAPRGVYADEVMILFGESLRRTHTQPKDYVVKVFGGGNMFPGQSRNAGCAGHGCSPAQLAACAGVGCKNIHAGRRLLGDHGFSIAAEDVGGNGSRQVLFDVWSGDVWVRQGDSMPEGLPVAG